jgi:hypothetical protein
MNSMLKWTKFEAIMTAVLAVPAISAPKNNSFRLDHIRILEKS